MIFKFQSTDRVGNVLYSIFDRMSKVIHRIDTPLITCIVMVHMSHTVNDRISHVDIRRSHIDLCTQNFLAILIFAFLHLLKKTQVLFDGTVSVWAFLTWSIEIPSVLSDLLCA